ncbi:MAG: RidA family protein [Nitriliruptoraceae bacterium]
MVKREFYGHDTQERGNVRAYSRAVVVEGGRTAYLAGVTSRGPDGEPVTDSAEAAARAVLDRLGETVELAGGSLADIVTMTVFITDPRYGDDFVRVRGEYFEEGRCPASALVTCTALARPGLMMEIQAIAVLDGERS